jgi:hypothetical protein
MSEDAFKEKADLIVQIMTIGQTITPNGQPLITAEEMQQGILDVLDDNGDLSVAENIFKQYEEYQTAVTEFNNNIAMQEQKQRIQDIDNQQQELQRKMTEGMQNMNANYDFESALNNPELGNS